MVDANLIEILQFEKGRMSESAERNRFVACLIRIIAQKEQQINAYRHNRRRSTLHESGEIMYGQTRSGLEDELQRAQGTVQVKEMGERVKNLEGQVVDLTLQLTQQTQINVEYQQKVKDLEGREKKLSESIASLQKKTVSLQEQVAMLRKQKEDVLFENCGLQEEVETLKVQAHYAHILQGKIESLTRQLSQWQKFQQRIRQNIESMTKKYCPSAIAQPSPRQSHNTKLDYILSKLSTVQHSLQMQHITSFPSNGLLDDTLNEMLMLMEHREQREECVGGWREKESCDCKSDHTTAAKESINHH